ncbi:MAG: tetratricopeptide repeat protein [Verrucomicrobia bacterium]|nr:tetratricopeptide repeat protein [Verrucomicrobiota bacterium]
MWWARNSGPPSIRSFPGRHDVRACPFCMSARKLAVLAPWILALGASLALFGPALNFDFLSYDDASFVRDNPRVASGLSWEAFKWALTANLFSVDRLAEYWMPLTLLSRQLDSQLFGLDGGWYHLQGILLHGLNAALVHRVLFQATGANLRSAMVALVFLIHPLNTEVVGWIALRKDVLAATFSLLTLLAYVRFQQTKLSRYYSLALVCFVAALASKPAVISLPLALFLLDLWPLGRIGLQPFRLRAWAEAALEKLPFLALALIGGFVTFVGQQDAGSARGVWEGTLGQRAASTAVGMLDYLERIFFPLHLCILYPQRNPASIDPSRLMLALLTLGLVTSLCLWLARRGKTVGLSGWLWFIGLLLPVSGLVSFGRQATADRYLYLPMIGFLFAFVWLVAEAWAARTRFGLTSRAWRPLGATAVLAALLGLAWKARAQIGTWRDTFTVWENAMATEPDHAFAMQILGGDHIVQGRLEVGETYLRAAIKLDPDRGEARGKLGFLLATNGKPAQAVPLLDEAIRYRLRDQKLHGALIAALQKLGRTADARRAEVRWHLIRVDAFLQKGLEMFHERELDLAREQFDLAWSAVAEARRSKVPHLLFRRESNYWAGMRVDIAEATRPEFRFEGEYLTAVLTYLHQPKEAIGQFRQICARFPEQAAAWWRLAICAREEGDSALAAEAEAKARRASRAAPDVEAEWKLDVPAATPSA